MTLLLEPSARETVSYWKVDGYYHELINGECSDVMGEILHPIVGQMAGVFHLIYADMIYDNFDFSWLRLCRHLLNLHGSIFVQTDYRSVAELKLYMDDLFGKDNFINWIVWPYDWDNPFDFQRALGKWVDNYNHDFPHQALGYRTPCEHYQNYGKNKELVLT